jgi:hypothetical protein
MIMRTFGGESAWVATGEVRRAERRMGSNLIAW